LVGQNTQTNLAANLLASLNLNSEEAHMSFQDLLREVQYREHKIESKNDDTLDVRLGDKISYYAENALAARPAMKLVWLAVFTLVLMAGLSVLWYLVNERCVQERGDDSCSDFGTFDNGDALFTTWMYMMAGEVSDTTDFLERSVIVMMIVGGMFTFAILVGFITEGITTKLEELGSGLTTVAASNHILILGWNASTVRLIRQICHAREVYAKIQPSRLKRVVMFFCMKKIPPRDFSICTGNIVVLSKQYTKVDMDNMLREGLAKFGINTHITRVGSDIICRVGDTTNTFDLHRVGAHRAKAIAVMTTDLDAKEQSDTGTNYNGTTLRTLLAVRQIQTNLLAKKSVAVHKPANVVVQMSNKSEAVSAASWVNHEGVRMVHTLQVKSRLNALLFTCAAQQGLSEVLLELLHMGTTRLTFMSQTIGEDPALQPLEGKTFQEAVVFFKNAIVVGIKRKKLRDRKKFGSSCMSTNMTNLPIEPEDELEDEEEEAELAEIEEEKEQREALLGDVELMLNPSPTEPLRKDDRLAIMTGDPEALPLTEEERSIMRVDKDPPFGFQRCIPWASPLQRSTPGLSNLSRSTSLDMHILVCGWREAEWQPNDKRFLSRMDELSLMAPGGASADVQVTFITALPVETFEQMFTGKERFKRIEQHRRTERIFKKKPTSNNKYTEYHNGTNLTVRHVSGDAAKIEDLEPVMAEFRFNKAIVLSTQHGIENSSHTKDTRVLSVLLLLRHIRLKLEKQQMRRSSRNMEFFVKPSSADQRMHSIGEIADDATGDLAALPDPYSAEPPDFVNANTMVARLIAQVLNDPNMDALWSELLSSSGSEVYIRGTEKYIPAEVLDSDGGCPFWQVQASVYRNRPKGGDICLGYRKVGGDVVLAPKWDEYIRFTKKAKKDQVKQFIILARDLYIDEEAG